MLTILPNESNSKTVSKTLLSLVFSIGMALGSGIAYGWSEFNSVSRENCPRKTCSQQQLLTRADYISLESGMSITDVQSILGKGIEVRSTETTKTLVWENCNNSSITVIFENYNLKSKQQSGL